MISVGYNEVPKAGGGVYGEDEAILSAQRQGKSVVGAVLFVTTFPCHNCMRHIIGAGIDKVYYVEAYPKSHDYKMYEDEMILGSEEYMGDISTDGSWYPPSKERRGGPKRIGVFAFTGVSQRMYRRAFEINGIAN